jgi:cytochrome P450
MCAGVGNPCADQSRRNAEGTDGRAGNGLPQWDTDDAGQVPGRRWLGGTVDEEVVHVNGAADYDLTVPETFQVNSLPEMWSQLRQAAPVYWHPYRDTGFWVVSHYHDVVAVYRDSTNFTSERGSVLEVLLSGVDPAGGRMLAVTDGPRHRAIRKVMTRFFTPNQLSFIAGSIRARVDRVVADAVARETVDFSTDVADRLPLEAICDLMAVPESDRPHLLACNKAALSSDEQGATALDAVSARAEIVFYLRELVARRRSDPGDDIVSALTTAQVDGRPLDDDDLALNCYSLILGGDESTRMSASTGAVAFARHPGQWHRLRLAGSVDPAVEEVLRWSTPSMHFARTATTDVTIADRTVRKGDVVTLWNTSANLDEKQFPDPDRFDIGRDPNDHVTFGQGRHYCLGAMMARLELRQLLAAMRERIAAIELRSEPRQVYSNFLYGFSSAPVRLVPSGLSRPRFPGARRREPGDPAETGVDERLP